MPCKNIKELYASQEAHRQRNKDRLWELLQLSSCIDCDESDPVVLEFDHVRGEKKFNVSRAIAGSTRSWTSIQQEINKCEIRCANCHRRVTAARGGFWRTSAQLSRTGRTAEPSKLS